MLALADRDGIVRCTIPGLADRARISIEECEHGLERFQQPDKYSWSKENEGRRIRIIDGGWEIINHAKFRQMMSADETREKTRIRVEKCRERKRKSLQSVTDVTSNASNDIATATATTTIKSRKGGGSSRPEMLENNGSKPPPPKNGKMGYTQSDFDQRDLRKMAEAQREGDKRPESVGRKSDKEYFEWICMKAGITVERGLELEKLRTQWPKETT